MTNERHETPFHNTRVLGAFLHLTYILREAESTSRHDREGAARKSATIPSAIVGWVMIASRRAM